MRLYRGCEKQLTINNYGLIIGIQSFGINKYELKDFIKANIY